MKLNKHLSLGFKSYIDAVKFIATNHLWKYFLIPLILFGLIFYAGHSFEEYKEASKLAIENGDYSWGLLGKIWLWIKIMFQSLVSFLLLDATKYLVIMLLSPLLALLSEKTEEILTGNHYEFNLKQLIKDVKRGIGIAIRMLFAEFVMVYLVWSIICWTLGLDDLLNYNVEFDENGEISSQDSLVYDAGAIIIGAYFYGFAYVDYINERLRLSIKESWSFMWKHSGLALSIGIVYSLLYKVPSYFNTGNEWLKTFADNFGVIIAPVLAIVAATIAMHKLVDLNNSRYAVKKKSE
jgi:CysZ protein